MDRKDFEKLKEEEKAHLREIAKLKQRLREARRVRSIGDALNEVESAGSYDDFDESLTKVQLEALENQVRMEMALGDTEASQATPDPEQFEADLSKARAAELVKHMKVSMGLEEATGASDESGASDEARSVGRSQHGAPPAAASSGGPSEEESDSDLEEQDVSKTIGRMKPRHE